MTDRRQRLKQVFNVDVPAWQSDALCTEYPDVNFYPSRGEDVTAAKAVCARCLVRSECEAYALDRADTHVLGKVNTLVDDGPVWPIGVTVTEEAE